MSHCTTPTSMSARPLLRGLAAAGLICCGASAALASIDNRDSAELIAVIWDPVGKASYSLDLGIDVNQFRIDAQQDGGTQRFWKLDVATDPRLASLRALGTPVGSLRWAVLGIDTQYDTFSPGDRRGFVTLQQGPAQGVANPDYAALVGADNGTWYPANDQLGNNYLTLLNTTVDVANNTHSPDAVTDNYAWNGSSFDIEGMPGYFGQLELGVGPSTHYSLAVAVTNLVGRSSWFYAATDSSFDPFVPIVVDEFDNIAHDGYWGLADNPADGSFALSYTLESALRTASQQEFAQSIGRSEIDGGFAVRRLGYADPVASPQGGVAGGFSRRLGADAMPPLDLAAVNVSAVPEPHGWALMLAGLAAVAGQAGATSARRRHRAASP